MYVNYKAEYIRLLDLCQAIGGVKGSILKVIYKNAIVVGCGTSKRQLLNLRYAQATIEKALTYLKKGGYIIYRSSNKQWCAMPIVDNYNVEPLPKPIELTSKSYSLTGGIVENLEDDQRRRRLSKEQITANKQAYYSARAKECLTNNKALAKRIILGG